MNIIKGPQFIPHPPDNEKKARKVYESAKKVFDEDIKVYLNYRYDLPPERLEIGDPDYDRFMCRGGVIGGLTSHISNFLRFDIKDLPNKDTNVVDELKEKYVWLVEKGRESFGRLKVESEMDEIHGVVKKIIELCDKLLEANKPASISVAA